MSTRRHDEQAGIPPAGIEAAFESGVVPRGLVFEDAPGLTSATPPWDVVHAYLDRGEHRFWVEAYAARSPAFADVLAALRNDHEEARGAARGVVVPFGRRR